MACILLQSAWDCEEASRSDLLNKHIRSCTTARWGSLDCSSCVNCRRGGTKPNTFGSVSSQLTIQAMINKITIRISPLGDDCSHEVLLPTPNCVLDSTTIRSGPQDRKTSQGLHRASDSSRCYYLVDWVCTAILSGVIVLIGIKLELSHQLDLDRKCCVRDYGLERRFSCVWNEFWLIKPENMMWDRARGVWLAPWMRYQVFAPLVALQAVNLFWYWNIWRIIITLVPTPCYASLHLTRLLQYGCIQKGSRRRPIRARGRRAQRKGGIVPGLFHLSILVCTHTFPYNENIFIDWLLHSGFETQEHSSNVDTKGINVIPAGDLNDQLFALRENQEPTLP
ncbi:hypothetical protein AG1IA_03512 [Rhizoctonia solani AG-1 IA]|uniref:Uncharacterized protein n=1 Tax=Thanatephorus cucumeris (strain AG1-IA) TaxID=983506 RepID=L8X084_THACA|nr:hypothetical protein AG1IA_03512 [Rhizoctonia solani AG-1 IA]